MQIEDFYKENLRISDPQLIQTLTTSSCIKVVKKGDVLQHIGCMSNNIYFLVEGVLRGYLLNTKGKELTDCFAYLQGAPIVSCADFGSPSQICIEALEDSEMISVPLSILESLLGRNMELMTLYNRLLRDALKTHWESKTVLVQYTAVERYQWFLKSYPGLIERVNHKYIASFLGMSPVSLSRTRRVVREQKTERRI